MCNIFQVQAKKNQGKYLGLPTFIRRRKKEVFDFVKDRVWHRLQGWRNKNLSRAGKEILLKTLAQAIPNYVMKVFLLPLNLCSELRE